MVCWCQGITYIVDGVRECKAQGGSKKVSFSFMICSECQSYHQSNRVGRLKDKDAWSALPADIKGPIQENIEKSRLIDAKATKKRRDLVAASHATEETGQAKMKARKGAVKQIKESMHKHDASEEQRNDIAHHLPLDATEPRMELEVCQADNIMAVEASFVADGIAHIYHHLPLDAAEPRLELELRRADNIMAVEASFVADDVDGMNLDDLMI